MTHHGEVELCALNIDVVLGLIVNTIGRGVCDRLGNGESSLWPVITFAIANTTLRLEMSFWCPFFLWAQCHWTSINHKSKSRLGSRIF